MNSDQFCRQNISISYSQSYFRISDLFYDPRSNSVSQNYFMIPDLRFALVQHCANLSPSLYPPRAGAGQLTFLQQSCKQMLLLVSFVDVAGYTHLVLCLGIQPCTNTSLANSLIIVNITLICTLYTIC